MIGRAADVRHVIEFFGGEYGRSLHVVGEAGVGKTALLDAVAGMLAAEGTRVLRADGVEFEAGVTYAGLHQILTPVLDQAEHLPPRLREALQVALGSDTGPVPDRLLLVNATLALLRHMAGGKPLLLVVDDLPWLDLASAAVLGFVARRLAGTGIGFLGASRSGVSSLFDHGGLAEMELSPLDDSSAHELLSERFPALAGRVRARVVAESGGIPLALLELPAELSGAQRAAAEGLPAVLPLGERLRSLFAARVTVLPEATRGLLLLAALDGTGDLGILRAAARAGEGLAALAPAERERLVRVDAATPRLTFRHPLIRSAVVTDSTLAERRVAHLALAEALAGRPERQVWHLAEAAIEPDEQVARQLQDTGHAALRRGDAVGAVTALTRAADLSPASGDRCRRLAEAAYIGAESTGDLANATELLRRARGADPGGSGALYAAAAAVYVLVDAEADLVTAHRLLTGAIEASGPVYDTGDPALVDALHTLQLVCWWSGREELWAPFVDTVRKLKPAPPPILALAARTFPDPARTAADGLDALEAARHVLGRTADPTVLVRGATATVYLDRVGELTGRLADLATDAEGPARRRVGALMHLCMEKFLTGEWEEARRLAADGVALCEDGYPFFAWYFHYNQVLLHAVHGESEAGDALAERMLRWAARRGVGAAAAFAHQARTLVSLGAGDYEAAYRHASALTPPGTLAPYVAHALWGAFDLVEAAVRTGRDGEAAAHVRVLRELGIARLSGRYAMLVAAAAGLAAPADEEAITLLRQALAVPGADRWAFEHARVRLALGERLRRTGDKAQARETLTAAVDAFTGLGARPWTERARRELRAAGPGGTDSLLTPQELEIAQLAASGLTNKQIGERLHLSHRTVSSHLYQIYPKLGITTRAALRDALTRTGSRAPSPGPH
ncbi:AAA family ATPase [Microtetraspora malaysiensis]|uniref:AAA family ATPase n=1 Tax=Microtetraspora malaysiensis TaxID=161358 RepID=UPI000833EE0B|nr:AAA family ATPase [Microtetraspora malaysiensis]